jgi:hypothetical protein
MRFDMAKASTKATAKARGAATGNYVSPAAAKAKTAVVERGKPKAAAAKPKAPARKK